MMAGIAASGGSSSHPNHIGAAPGADIYSVRIVNPSQVSEIDAALELLVVDLNCQVIMKTKVLDVQYQFHQMVFI